MLLKKEFFNIKCDCCGCIADERTGIKQKKAQGVKSGKEDGFFIMIKPTALSVGILTGTIN